MSECPLVTTDQIATYYSHRGSPTKRASETLTELEDKKLVEGKRRAIGESKIWRLTKRGRDALGCKQKPVSFTSGKLGHYLALTDVYQSLSRMGTLSRWMLELREPFEIGNRAYTYCPDAFFVFQNEQGKKAFLLEVQTSPITSTRWGEKWAIASSFFESPVYKTASFQYVPNKIIRPRIVVISNQQPDTVQGGSKLTLIKAPSIEKAALFS